MQPGLARAVGRQLGSEVVRWERLHGGDINEAYQVTLAGGRCVFVKANPKLAASVFAAEARGLDWLREANALRIPSVLAVADAESEVAFLALELLETAPPSKNFDVALGHGLARLHRATAASFGLDHDNFVGSLPQSNAPAARWSEFFRDRRLLPQLRRAQERNRLGASTLRRLDALLAKLDELVGPEEPPARLHGDLWAGNLHVGPRGEPCLIDPACYAGHREVDLAMMRLFGGFTERAFDAYVEVHPPAPGHGERVPLYQLYPLLVHVNLFGGGYAASVDAALSKLV